MDFFNDIFHNLALLEFYFLNIIYILFYIEFILSIFFQHSNILTRASHHWCLASNIVLVSELMFSWTGFTAHLISWAIIINHRINILIIYYISHIWYFCLSWDQWIDVLCDVICFWCRVDLLWKDDVWCLSLILWNFERIWLSVLFNEQ